jgi:error-prone DNA polymerase
LSYAELHALSNFSFQRGASHAEELITQAADLGYAAIAITDECSLAGVVRAHQAAQMEGNRGRIRLIVGAEFRFADGFKLVLLAPTRAAYEQLSALITRGRRAATKGSYRLEREDAAALCPDCFALWPVGSTSSDGDAQWLRAHFAHAWIAVELHRAADDAARIARCKQLAQRHALRCVAAGDVHYHSPQRRPLQDVMTALRHQHPVADCGARLLANAERHLRPLRVLRELYPAAWLEETLAIAQRCRFELTELKYEYPHELVPEGQTPTAHLRALTMAGVHERWPDGAEPQVVAQIEKELALIADLGYEAFFLTVHDIVRYARSRGILCQGRGSAANSAVCYALGITAVDPSRSRLLFERFISRERAEPPDIDVDFEHQRREEVIQYVFDKYGRERAALAATVITYRPRSALRDVGRALGMPPEDIDRLAKSLAWWDKPDKLPQRLASLGFDPEAPDLQRWIVLTQMLIGMPRHLSQHVGGFVISEQPLSNLVPVENAAMPERTVIQWDRDDLEALGLLKVDVLALGMLSAIRRALALREAFRGMPMSLAQIPAEDADTYAMIRRAETLGVFQIESRAQINMLARLQPRTFYDLVTQVAIVRPGPIQGGMVHPYLKRRCGEEEVDYPPRLRNVLERTLGVPIFQEQVMEIAIIAAGFTPGEADQMRRSMAAWKRSGGLEKFRERLLSGMAERGYASDFAERIYQQILGFGSYGFPESHAASFALLAYASAWLKCHEPAAFFAALLNSQPMGFYPPSMLVREAQRAKVEVRAVDVTASCEECTLERRDDGEPAIRLGFNLVHGLTTAAAQAIVRARKAAPFRDVDDLSARAGLDARGRRALVDADALAPLAGHRHAARWAVSAGAPRDDLLLPLGSGSESEVVLPRPTEGAEITDDYRSIGVSLRRHPVALLRPRLAKMKVRRNADLATLPDRSQVTVAGIVMFRQRPQTPTGVMFMTLEDETGTVNLVVPAKALDEQRDALIGTRFLIVRGRLQNAAGTVHVFLHRAEDRSDWLGELRYLSRDFH